MKILATILSIMLSLTSNAALIRNVADKPAEDTAYIENQVREIKQNTKRKARVALANEDAVYTVTFDCNGGTYNGLETFKQTVTADSLLEKPDSTKLVRYNSKFVNWKTVSGDNWNFTKDTVKCDIELRASWNWDSTLAINDESWGMPDSYFLDKYYKSSNWSLFFKRSMAQVSGYIPIEMQGYDSSFFPKSDILTAIETSGVDSSYGGCGPIAMMGIFDYFSRYKGYTSIINDPTNSDDRIRLAYDVLTNTTTYEMPSLATSAKVQMLDNISLYSGGSKNTLTLPSDYVVAFNKLMKNNYHLDNQIVAHNQGYIGVSKNSKINKIKQFIDAGLPVTVYAALAGEGKFANHYVNVYEYQIWEGKDRDGNYIHKTIFVVRLNYGREQSKYVYMDADMLEASISGVIYYTVADNNQIIRPSDFSKDFVNDNGQGQYFFYEKTADITTANGFVFGTKRLRCGYIENEYVVLSANRSGAGRAFLELNFDLDVKAINMDIALWKDLDAIGAKDSIKMLYKDVKGKWHELREFYTYELSSLREYPSNYYIEFPEITRGIKIEVTVTDPDGDRNQGRVVIGDMNLFY